jgi:replication-associated recombination protein RarA
MREGSLVVIGKSQSSRLYCATMAAVCVHGPLGIGKTALARVVVERESRAGVIARPRASSVRSVFAAGPS